MKSIIDICNSEETQTEEGIKLRLRGRGSGYKEGPSHKESFEPLQLCVSGKKYSKFKLACQLVEEHLKTIYMEYKIFLDMKYNGKARMLHIVKKEEVSHKKPYKK